ncbi:MAG: hypothetical protein J6J55_06280 [Paludibacteraceae bacterium]|nr:hypothetical protein [Paludibacteraceae bacterium]
MDKKQFLPTLIAVSALLLPAVVMLAIGFFLCFEMHFLVFLCAFVLTYIVVALFLWRVSRREAFFLELTESKAKIVYEDALKGKTELQLSFQEIHSLTYYRINSIKGWFMTLIAYRFPKSVHLEYTDGTTICGSFIGYLDYADIQAIANITKANLKVY